MTLQEIQEQINNNASEETLHEMGKMGINTANAAGVPVKTLRVIAKSLRRNHDLALELWATGQHEARILATYVADPHRADEELLDKWVSEVNSWDLCDQFCANVAAKSELGKIKLYQWAVQDEIYTKRAGFSLMAIYALKDTEITDNEIDSFFTLILNECSDSRIYVRKAVAWALKNIGKKDKNYKDQVLKLVKLIRDVGGKAGKATATEVLTELNSTENKKQMKGKTR